MGGYSVLGMKGDKKGFSHARCPWDVESKVNEEPRSDPDSCDVVVGKFGRSIRSCKTIWFRNAEESRREGDPTVWYGEERGGEAREGE